MAWHSREIDSLGDVTSLDRDDLDVKARVAHVRLDYGSIAAVGQQGRGERCEAF